MAKTKISEYDSTAANNTDIDSINIAENCAPSGINNAIRELMAHLKDMNIGSTITMLNTTEEDSDGGRANKIIFKGEQSGGEESVLGEIQFSHDGTADDQKADFIIKTNDGSDGTSPTEAMRIDSYQNVGIGCVPNSIQSGFDTLQIGGNLTLNVDGTGAGAGVYMGNNVYRDSGNSRWEYIYTDEASQYLQANGEHIWRYAASGTADTAITWSEAMRIDSDGKTTITNTSAGASTTPFVLHNASSNANTDVRMLLAPCTTAADRPVILAATNNGSNVCHFTVSTPNGGTPVERLRVDGTGKLFIGATSSVGSSLAGLELSGTQGNNHIKSAVTLTTGYDAVVFINGNGVVGRITTNGSGTSFSSGSDYRLKENVVDISDAIKRVKELSPRRFNFIADADTTVDGFLAHEAQTVVPEAVTGTKDAVEVWKEHEELPDGVAVGDNKLDDDGNTIPDYQSIDQAKLVPLLTAALQEAIAKIETLETRVAALEG